MSMIRVKTVFGPEVFVESDQLRSIRAEGTDGHTTRLTTTSGVVIMAAHNVGEIYNIIRQAEIEEYHRDEFKAGME